MKRQKRRHSHDRTAEPMTVADGLAACNMAKIGLVTVIHFPGCGL